MSAHRLSALLALLLLPAAAAFAQEQEYGTIRTLDGSAQVLGARESQPQEVTLNTPLLEGDTLWTGRSGRLEVFLQDGTRVWLDYDTRIEADRFPDLNPTQPSPLQARLWKGTALVEVQNAPPANASYVLATPSATVQFRTEGLYLLEVESVDRTQVTALQGSCEVTSSGSSVRLGPDQMTYAEYGYGPTPPRPSGGISARGLLSFRDGNLPRPSRGNSSSYLPDSLGAYAPDLDAYGTWSYTGSYGYVWRPFHLSAGWSPYRHGHWRYTPWGATWVSSEIWGWAPFHYGRWVFVVGFGWSWVPGFEFSPAWVAWYWGDGWIGWCPWGWDGPMWNYGGWCSVSINNFYVTNVTTVIVNHTGPPPSPPIVAQPPLHKPNGRGGVKEFDRGARGEGIHLQPRQIEEYGRGRLNANDLKGGLTRPPSQRPSTYPIGDPDHRALPPVHRPGQAETRPPTRPSGERTLPGSGTERAQPPASRPTEGRGTRPEVAPRPQAEPSPRYEPPTRSRPPARQEEETRPSPQPRYEPPARQAPPSYEPEPPARYEPPARQAPPSYEPPRPAPQPRYEPPARQAPPSYEPPRPTPQPRYEPPARQAPPAPRYEPPPSRSEPRQSYSPPPRPAPAPAPPSPPPPQSEDKKKVNRH